MPTKTDIGSPTGQCRQAGVIALDFAWHCRRADMGMMSGIMRL